MANTSVPWARIAGFIRQHTHDVRNDLNSVELESVLLQELLPEGNARDGLARIRKQVRSLAEKMRKLSALFQDAQPISGPMPAKSLLSIWRDRHKATPNAPEFRWVDKLGNEIINVDVEMMANAIQELLSNSISFPPDGPVTVTASSKDQFVDFEVQEPKTAALDTEAWGQPFFSTRRGSYGLGLWIARSSVERNRGSFEQHFDGEQSALVTTVALPKAS